jgi:hypothetical protein
MQLGVTNLVLFNLDPFIDIQIITFNPHTYDFLKVYCLMACG